MSALHESLSLLKHQTGNLHVPVSRLVKGRGNDLGIDGTCHIRHLLRTLIDEEHHDICLWMVGSNGVGDILHQNSLTRLGLSHNERTLSLANRREQIYDTRRDVGGAAVTAESEFLFGEKRCEVLKGYTVTYLAWITAIDLCDATESEVFLCTIGGTYLALYHITCFKGVLTDLLYSKIYIIGG